MWQGLRSALVSRPDITSRNRLRTTLFYLIFFRVLIVIFLLSSNLWAVLATGQDGTKATVIYWSMAATVFVSLFSALWLRAGRGLYVQGYFQLFFDVVLSTTVVYISGGGISPFIFLYLLVILESAVIFGRHGSVIIAALCGVSYALLVSNILPSLDHAETPATAAHILGVYLALVLIALVSSYLSKQVEVAASVVNSVRKDLNNLVTQQQQLFDDVSEGIITLNLEQMITNINQAASAIIGLTEGQSAELIGKPFSSMLSEHGIEGASGIFAESRRAEGTGEIAFQNPTNHSPVRISYTLHPIVNSDGNDTGTMFMFNDVSHVRNMEDLLSLHEKMAQLLSRENSVLPAMEISSTSNIVGESTVMRQVFSLVQRVSTSDASVLVMGESGTGKELVARAIHLRGPRRAKPFVAINCGAIPENLIESELFGHRRGSFTGAFRDNPGLFKQATGGTMFLDEVGELPLLLQTKLLRVLQEKTVRAVGDTFDVSVDVRVIAASNRDLREEVRQGRFREDLYYRLNVVNIVIPPLRMRKDDIPHLVRYFIGKYAPEDTPLPQISPEALQMLIQYPFPGNVRELENILERALVLGSGAILPEHLPPELHETRASLEDNGQSAANGSQDSKNFPIDLERELEQLERHYLFRALDQTGGAKKQAAKLLGLNFRSFRYRLKKYGVSETDSLS